MATKAMWEVDPETRSKLLAIQKESKNNICCDCNAPSPQWASPKFGIFICLSCAGVHRGLGVHISFVRSISMDAFKAAEIERMRLGGNENWRTFFENHSDTKMRGLSWDDATIAERYGGEVGEEWKERLSAKVEGREYVPDEKPTVPSAPPQNASAAAAPTRSMPRTTTPLSSNSRTGSPAPGGGGGGSGGAGKVKVDDKYFARLGQDNASRPEDLHPSQGGKYAGFGNTPMPQQNRGGDQALPGFEELQKDPVAALTKGFGWFASTVTKTAKTVNNDFIQPTARQIAESDLAAQARTAAGQVAKTAQAGARTAQQGIERFVEGPTAGGYREVPIDESKRAFWDDFADLADQRTHQGGGSSSIGTAAMGKGGNRSSWWVGAGTSRDRKRWIAKSGKLPVSRHCRPISLSQLSAIEVAAAPQDTGTMSSLRILVPVKRVIDYAVKPRVNKAQTGVETAGVKHSMNPFDELSVEESVRIRERKSAPVEDICVISAGPPKAQDILRTAMAMGADRAIHVETKEGEDLEPLSVAKLLKSAVEQQKSNLVILGKQSIDDDAQQTGQMLAGLLGWAQATQASKVAFEGDNVVVTKEVDGGVETVKAKLPMIITTDLRLNEPRYASLPNIMKAKKKPLEKKTLVDFGISGEKRLKIVKVTEPPPRQGGGKVEDVDGLISKLKELGAL
ncbi:Zn finger-containing GTPase activating protein for ARF [Diplogelasinospora grovesii]|uniref:Probable electron transfer flavoprotein subunit beta n=1 Tax=Diplogelasinospora grovesii TaxID=303347 RepID=A0AAN6S991_9PEZI|nr:Zn finger-containing GTPase activating protein for ARF [Diplogelasinospora grovesii]